MYNCHNLFKNGFGKTSNRKSCSRTLLFRDDMDLLAFILWGAMAAWLSNTALRSARTWGCHVTSTKDWWGPGTPLMSHWFQTWALNCCLFLNKNSFPTMSPENSFLDFEGQLSSSQIQDETLDVLETLHGAQPLSHSPLLLLRTSK